MTRPEMESNLPVLVAHAQPTAALCRFALLIERQIRKKSTKSLFSGSTKKQKKQRGAIIWKVIIKVDSKNLLNKSNQVLTQVYVSLMSLVTVARLSQFFPF